MRRAGRALISTQRCVTALLPSVSSLANVDKRVFVGGLRKGTFNATWPFARMTVDDGGVVIRVLGFPAFDADWSALEFERVVGGLLASPGIRLTRSDGLRVVFWSFRPGSVIAELRARGAVVRESQDPPRIWGRP